MRSPITLGLIGGAVIGLLQFYSMLLSMEDGPVGGFEMFLYYSPQIIFFAVIYMSIKIHVKTQPEKVPGFKGCLRAGGVTSLLVCIFWGVGFFVGLTHLDVALDVKRMIASGHGDMVNEFLSHVTKQVMMDRTQFWIIPNFLLGFAMTVLVTVIFRLRGKKAV